MKFSTGRNMIGLCWVAGGLGFYGLLILQSLLNVYERETEKIWAWALPTMMQTLLLIIGVQATEAVQIRKRRAREPVLSKFFFALTLLLSAFYIGIVFLTVLVPAIKHGDPLILMQ